MPRAQLDECRKLRDGALGGAQINKTLKLLAQILDTAIEYEIIDGANPARGRRRRVKAPKVHRAWVEPEQLVALIEASDEYHRPIVATLAGAGLRVGEAVALNWRDVNLATGVLRVGQAKTAAGDHREVDLPGGLIEALSEWKAQTPCSERGDPIFVSRSRRRQTVTNIDHRLKTAVKAANRKLAEVGIQPISTRCPRTPSDVPTRALGQPSGTIPSTSLSRAGGLIRCSYFASTRRLRSAVSDSKAPTLKRSMRPANGHQWAPEHRSQRQLATCPPRTPNLFRP